MFRQVEGEAKDCFRLVLPSLKSNDPAHSLLGQLLFGTPPPSFRWKRHALRVGSERPERKAWRNGGGHRTANGSSAARPAK